MGWDDDLRAAAADMLEMAGVAAVAAGGSINVLFQAPGQVVELGDGGRMVTSDPAAQALDTDVAALGIVGGANGTELTINGTDYVVRAAVPDGNYFVRLTLEAI